MIQDGHQEVFIELKCVGKLLSDLPDTVHPLHEHWTPVWVIVLVLTMSYPLTKLVSEAQPLLLHQHHEPGEGPVVAVQHQHGQTGQLTGPVPPVTAVNNYTRPVNTHLDNISVKIILIKSVSVKNI